MRIIVLNDGETYTSAEGCLLLDVNHLPEGDDIDDAELKNATEFFSDSNVLAVDMKTESGLLANVEVIARF